MSLPDDVEEIHGVIVGRKGQNLLFQLLFQFIHLLEALTLRRLDFPFVFLRFAKVVIQFVVGSDFSVQGVPEFLRRFGCPLTARIERGWRSISPGRLLP